MKALSLKQVRILKAKNLKLRLPVQQLRGLATKILSAHRRSDVSIEVYFVRSAEIKKLNQKFRGKNKATDVLSFPAQSINASNKILGSIAIDIDTARAQAKSYGHSLNQELLELFMHGVLHLLGYDHEDSRDAKVMKQQEEKFIKMLKRKTA